MPTFPKGHSAFLTRLKNAKTITAIIREHGGTLAEAREPHTERRRREDIAHTAADGVTLRGIPAIGRGVAGHIAHTQPETAATREAKTCAPTDPRATTRTRTREAADA